MRELSWDKSDLVLGQSREQRELAVDKMSWFIVAFSFLDLVIPGILWYLTKDGVTSTTIYLVLLLLAFSGMQLALITARGNRHLLQMVFWLFVYVFLGVAPFVQLRAQVMPSTTPWVRPEYIQPAVFLVMLGCGAFWAGTWFGRVRPADTVVMREREVIPSRVRMLTTIALLLVAYQMVMLGPAAFLGSRTELSVLRSATWGSQALQSLITGGTAMSLLVAYVAQVKLRAVRKEKGLPSPLSGVALTLVCLIYVVNPISSPRYVFGTVALAILATFGIYATKNRFRLSVFAAVFGLLFIFPLADMFRRSREAATSRESLVTSLLSGDFDAFMQIANTVDFTTAGGHTFGGQFLGALFFWVPRPVWPNKPIDTGVVLAEHMGYSFTNLSSPLWSETFLDFGVVGMAIIFAVLGYLFFRADQRVESYMASSRVPSLLVTVVAFYLLIILRGSLLNAFSYLAVIVLSAFFVSRKSSSTG